MSEQMKRPRGHEVIGQRHSIAQYIANDQALISDDPSAFFDIDAQLSPDLTPEGIRLAREKAAELYDALDPARDKLFFVSSKLARALETAAIYAEVAKEKGFEVIPPGQTQPKHVKSDIAERLGGKDVRVLRNLTARAYSPLGTMIFSPDTDKRLNINWEKVDPTLKAKWEEAHAIVTAGGKETWNGNFVTYSEKIAALFPEFGIESARELFDRQFSNLARLAAFGIRKAQEAYPEESIKILAFGHDNYIGHAFQNYFNDHDIKNCETVIFSPSPNGDLQLERRGISVSLRKSSTDAKSEE